MKLASFQIQERNSWGAVDGSMVRDVGSVLAGKFPDLKSFIALGVLEDVRETIGLAPGYTFGDVSWLPVIPNPEKIFCVGLNYETHRKETGRAAVERPTIFARFPNT